jgi:biotin carboxyl carrier protein
MKKTLVVNKEEITIDLVSNRDSLVEFIFNGKTYKFSNNSLNTYETIVSGDSSSKVIHDNANFVVDGKLVTVCGPNRSRSKSNSDHAGAMISPMPGKILKVNFKIGDKVSKGDAVVVMEAMKMEHTIKASDDGVISEIFYNETQLVDGGVELIALEVES